MTIDELKELCEKEIKEGKGSRMIWIRCEDTDDTYKELKNGFTEDNDKCILLG